MSRFWLKKYDYSTCPLRNEPPESRVLELLPGPFNNVIRLRLNTIVLEQDIAFPFEALSYVWGDQKHRRRVYVLSDRDRVEPKVSIQRASCIKITRNLYTALQHIRDPTKSRTLWIDAICIDQSNLAERGQQVQRMPLIYKQATHTILWLGPEGDNSSHAFDVLRRWAEDFEYDFVHEKGVPKTTNKEHIRTTSEVSDACTSEKCFIATSALIHCPYFERAWIRQEISLSQFKATVQCGSERMPWFDFRSAVCCLGLGNVAYPSTCAERLRWRLRVFTVRNLANFVHSGFLELLHTSGELECLDPRDKVYSVLGMLRKDEAWILETIKPNYNISYEELRCQVFMACTAPMQRLNVMQECEERTSLPTWAPGWSKVATGQLEKHSQYTDGCVFAPCIEIDGFLLTVKAVRCDVIANVHGWPFRLDLDVPTEEQVIAQLRSIRRSVEAENPGAHCLDFITSMAYNISVGLTRDHVSGSPELQVWYNGMTVAEIKDVLATVLEYSASRTSKEHSDQCASLVSRARAVLDDRALAGTNTGRLPVVPGHTLPGDILMVLLGLSHVAVLRPHRDGTYLFVGIAFAHGLNWGEALFGPLPLEWRYVTHFYEHRGEFSMFQHIDADEPTAFDPRIDWDELEVGKEDPRCAVWDGDYDQAQQYYRRPDEEYLLRHGVKLETITIA